MLDAEIFVVDKIESGFALLIAQDLNCACRAGHVGSENCLKCSAINCLEQSHTKSDVMLSLTYLPENIKEGDVLRLVDGVFYVDEKERMERENRINEKLNILRKRGVR